MVDDIFCETLMADLFSYNPLLNLTYDQEEEIALSCDTCVKLKRKYQDSVVYPEDLDMMDKRYKKGFNIYKERLDNIAEKDKCTVIYSHAYSV